MLDNVRRARPHTRGAYTKGPHFFAPRPLTSVLSILCFVVAAPPTVDVRRRVRGRHSNVVADRAGQIGVVIRIRIHWHVLIVYEHPRKQPTEFKILREIAGLVANEHEKFQNKVDIHLRDGKEKGEHTNHPAQSQPGFFERGNGVA